jgi:hypothetical protein
MTALLASIALMGGPVDYPGCNTHACVRRVQARAHAKTVRRWRRVVKPHDAYLTRIARCESGLRWRIATGNGFYGGLQFTLRSWAAVGGSGFPHHASPLEQKYRAVRLSRLQGWGAWPECRHA